MDICSWKSRFRTGLIKKILSLIFCFLIGSSLGQNWRELNKVLLPSDKRFLFPDSSRSPVTVISKTQSSCQGLLDSMVHGYLTQSGWSLQIKMVYTYYPAGKIKDWTSFTWHGTKWENNSRGAYSYDTKDSLIHFKYLVWKIYGPGWNTLYQEWYSYDSNGNKLTYFNNDAWQHFYTYDENNNQISELTQFWSGSAWKKDRWYLFHYNEDNLKTEKVSQFWNQTVWDTNYREIYSYDSNKNLTMGTHQHGLKNYWEDAGRNVYKYDSSNNLIENLFQSYWNSAWKNDMRWFYNWGLNNELLNQTLAVWWNKWDTTYHDVRTYDQLNNLVILRVDTNRTVFTYDSCKNKVTECKEYLKNSNWIRGDSAHYYYTNFHIGILENQKRQMKVNIYPNPNSGAFTLNYESAESGLVSLIVRNALGQTILYREYDKKTTVTETLDLRGLSKGIYFVQANNEQATEVKKIVVE